MQAAKVDHVSSFELNTEMDKHLAQLAEIDHIAKTDSNPHLVKLRLLGPEACVSTLQQKWATHAVVGALIAACTYPLVVNPPESAFESPGHLSIAGGLFLLCAVLSFIFAVCNIMAALFASTELAVFILNRKDLGWFLVKWTGTGKGGFNFIDIPDQLMIVSLIFVILSIVPGLIAVSKSWPSITYACVSISIVVVVLAICLYFLTSVIKYYVSQYGAKTSDDISIGTPPDQVTPGVQH